MDSIADGRLCKIDHSGPALFKYPAWAAALVARGVSVRSRLQGFHATMLLNAVRRVGGRVSDDATCSSQTSNYDSSYLRCLG
jgi:hypothetical protein